MANDREGGEDEIMGDRFGLFLGFDSRAFFDPAYFMEIPKIPGKPEKEVLMNIPELVALVLAVTQFVKNFAAKLGLTIEKGLAVAVSVLVSIGVVLYDTVANGKPFGFQVLVTIIEVAIGANAGYSLLKVARTPTK